MVPGTDNNREVKTDYEKFLCLLEYNNDKMNFQQNMCFQIRNWAMVTCLGALAFAWNFNSENEIIAITLHGLIIIWLVYLFLKNKDWFGYFIVFRERVRLFEGSIIGNKPIKDLKIEYYKVLPESEMNVSWSRFSTNEKWEICIYYLIFIILTAGSLIVKVVLVLNRK